MSRPISLHPRPARPLFDAEDHVCAAADLAAAVDSIMQEEPERLSRDTLLGLGRIVAQIADHTRAVREAWIAEYGSKA